MSSSEQMNIETDHQNSEDIASIGANKRGESIISRYKRSINRHIDGELAWYEDGHRLSSWFMSEYSGLTVKSFNRNKQWLMAYLRNQGLNHLVDEITPLTSPAKPVSEKKVARVKIGLSDKTNNSAGLAASNLQPEHINAFYQAANAEKNEQRRYKDGQIVNIFFQLICMTGIRPSEWARITLIDNLVDTYTDYGLCIRVIGASKGKRDATGERNPHETIRHLSCQHWTEYEKNMLRLFVSHIPSSSEEMKVLLNNLSSVIRKISKRAFYNPSYINLYDARHLYASEFRRSEYGTKYSLAAALGHNDITNQKYYGDHHEQNQKRLFDWSLAYPLESEELKVRANAERRFERTLERLQRFGKTVQRSTDSMGGW